MDKAHSHNIYDTDMDVVSGGLQVEFTSRQGRLHHSLEAYYQVHFLREKRIAEHTGQQYFYDRESGTGRFEEVSYYGPAVLSGRVQSFGVTMTTRF